MSSLRLKALYALCAQLIFNCPGLGADYSTSVTARVRPISPLTTGLNFIYSPLLLKGFEWDPGERFEKTGYALNLEVEWLPFADLWGKPAIGTTFGYSQVADLTASPKRELHLFPVGLFFSYRFDYLNRQWLVPYVKAGGSVIFAQRSSGGQIENVWHWDYGAGLAISLGAIDTYSVRHLDSKIGINDFFITVEYVKSVPMRGGNSLNLAHEEFRFGIRFEI